MGQTWSDLVFCIPPELEPYILDFEWEPARLRALDLPTDAAPVAALEWNLDLPWWQAGGRPFTLRPHDVLRHPRRFPEHHGRILNADLRYPIDVTRRSGRWTVMDGIHRLAKARLLGRDEILARRVPSTAFEQIQKAA